MAIRVKLVPIEATIAFSYLGRTATYNNSNCAELYINLRKAQYLWGMIAKVMGKKGAPIKAQPMMYKMVVQAVLLYGSEIWVVIDAMMMVLEGFHHSIARRITGMTAHRDDVRKWE